MISFRSLFGSGFRFLIILVFCLFALFHIISFDTNNYTVRVPKIQTTTKFHFDYKFFLDSAYGDMSCYVKPSTQESVKMLLIDEVKDNDNISKNIFFHETSCFGDEDSLLTSRQACAVESAAKMNSNMKIYLLIVSDKKFSSSTLEKIKILLTYENIAIRRIYLPDYFKDTPLEEWWSSGKIKSSNWPRIHMSDALRYLTLWKFGGIYIDLDVIVKSSLNELVDFVGAQDALDVANGFMGFGKTNLGRQVANDCLQDFNNNFRGDAWAHNGPAVITRVLQKLCNTTAIPAMNKQKCSGFNVYPPSSFYPINWTNWKLYFDEKEKNSTMKKIENALAIHVWNKLSSTKKIPKGSQAPYAILANKYCPKTYNNINEFF